MENKRFEITETAGSVKGFYVVVDKETGVNYLVRPIGRDGRLFRPQISFNIAYSFGNLIIQYIFALYK